MYIVTAEEMYGIDRETMGSIGVDGKILMENAGREVSREIKKRITKNDVITVLVGGGNNGGDGFVVARTLHVEGFSVQVVQVVGDEKIRGDADYHKNLFLRCNGLIFYLDFSVDEVRHIIKESTVVVDAMVGIGVKGNLKDSLLSVAQLVNKSNKQVIAIDIPSGLPAEEYHSKFYAVQADTTVLIGALKQSLFLQDTASYYGEWVMVSIGFPNEVIHRYTDKQWWNRISFQSSFPKRKETSHKGTHGRGLVIGGNRLMPGSVMMTTKAAIRSGAGLTTTGTSKEVISIMASSCNESMYVPIQEEDGYLSDASEINYSAYDAVAIGMGIGRENVTQQLIQNAITDVKGILLVDADGLYHLKERLSGLKSRQKPTILTPHPGEMASLLDVSISQILQKPFTFSKDFAIKYGVYLVLKGKFTIITSPTGRQVVESGGNPGLAKGGSGDVLSGIILAMVMQDQPIFEAICNGCYLHSASADNLVKAEHSVYDLTATDVIEGIPKALRTLTSSE
ncbi:NAD(P)H-hydrate dehydratase [Oceanobacillus sp. 1P07AA]|uniref:NAD(P)H-hydrate dehydratase n=1 Tax=Oceanobacillus sp. 1P07AA TaxID=3132293 RepID=UPI0039A6EEDE